MSGCAAAAGALLVAALVATRAVAGTWLPTGPADGGRSVGTHPTVAGQAMISQWSDTSTWFTSDAGAHWSGSPWRDIAYRPVLAGTPTVAWMVSFGQLFRSTDQGRSWRQEGPVELSYAALFVAVNPADTREMVLVGPYKYAQTGDGGTSWTIEATPGIVQQASVDWTTRRAYVCLENEAGLPHPPASRRLLDTPASWTSVGPNARYAGAGNGVLLVQDVDGMLHRSIDHGASFVAATGIDYPVSIGDIAYSRSTPTRVYAFDEMAYPGVLRSDDGGATWSAMADVIPAYITGSHIAVDASNADRVYAATGDGVLESLDGAATFHELSRVSGAPAKSRRIAVDAADPAVLWSFDPETYEAMVRRSTDGGTTWQPVAGSPRLWGVSRQRTNTAFGAPLDGYGFWVSEDGGASWIPTLQPPPSYQYFGPFAHGPAPGRLLLVGWGFDEAGTRVNAVFVSSDDGRTFVQRPGPPIHINTMAASASGPPTIYAGGFTVDVVGGPQLWRSTDDAMSWQPVATFPHPWNPPLGNQVTGIEVDPVDPQRLYVGLALPHHLMKSVDGGATWTRATVGLGSGAVVSIVVDPAQPATLYAAEHGSGVFRSADRGETWTALDEGLRDASLRQLLLDPHHPGRLYAGTDSGLFKVELGTGLPSGHRRAVEYYHPAFDHYFVSADLDEIAGLDSGVFAGWARTGEGFRVGIPDARGRGFLPVCRFFGVGFAPLSSHFYTPYPGECEIVKADPKWLYEKTAFGLALPDEVTRGCPAGTRPLYRAWNRNAGGAPNHRYNADWQSMDLSVLRQGWVLEGEAATNVFACIPVD